jgi:hypothetical protein
MERIREAIGIPMTEMGPFLNKMIRRSSTVGFLPVAKALYSAYLDIAQTNSLLETQGIQGDLTREIFSYLNWDDVRETLLRKLSDNLERHHQANP